MEKCFDEKKIAKLTGTAVQDDETFRNFFVAQPRFRKHHVVDNTLETR